VRRPVARLRGPKGAAAGAAALFAATASVLASAAPALASSGYGQLIVNPGTSAPGQTVSILGTCPNNGSTLTGVYSAAFSGGQASITKGSVNFTGTATIAGGVSAGQYEVSAKCGPGSPMVVITVSGSGGTTASQPAMAPSSTWAAPSSPSTWRSTNPAPASSAAMGMGGGMAPTPSAKPSAMASTMAGAMSSASVTATNPPVTSTGIVRVGLAGSGRSTMISTPVAAAAAAAIAATGTVSFLLIRRRRGNSGTHSSHS